MDAAFAAVITVTWRALGVAGTFEVARASAYGYDQRCEVWTATGAALSVGNHVATSLEVGGAAPKVRRGDAVLATLVAEAARRSAACGRPVALKNPAGSADPADLVLVEG